MKTLLFNTFLFLLPLLSLQAQEIGNSLGDEQMFKAETKQVNQFYRRFNGEESPEGKRYYEGNRQYRSKKLRQDYFAALFDQQNPNFQRDLAKKFADDILNTPLFLDFHGGRWYSEVSCTFFQDGREVDVTLFLRLVPDRLGHKWIINEVFYPPFQDLFAQDSTRERKFLHPMSHELSFMNLVKAFRDKETIEDYTEKSFRPDYVTLLLYEIKQGRMQFKTVKNTKFHFFQLDNWYFELQYINRAGYNRGWLITNLAQMPEANKKQLLDFIFYGKM